MGRAVGIDLGTTNSVVAVLEGGEPTVIANSEGSRTTPSVVAFAKNGELLVGQPAKNQAVTNVDRTIRSVKRHMGTGWKVQIDDKTYTPQEISARVLMKLKRDAESYLGEDVTDAVVTVPAYFDDSQRQTTKEAGQIAGLNVLRIINEPTAAALAYGLEKGEKEQTILVFDLGGGTFDVSLLEVGEGLVEVKATSGDTHLGGDDWDERVVEWLVDKFRASAGIDLTKDRMAMQRIKEAAEKAKIELSSSSQTSINLPYITVDADKNPLFLDETLSRAEFERITSDLLERCRKPFNNAIRDAGVKVGDINHVVLVGGATRMPAVTDLVRELTDGKEPNKGVNPDEVVAVGAALQAGVLRGEVLTGLPPAPRGLPQIEVTFDIDANGIVHVNAKDLGTGRQQSIKISGGSALPKDDIDRMVKDAEAHADEDRKRREEAETRNQAETLVYQTEKVLTDNADKIPADTRTQVQDAIKDVNEALKGDDVDKIRSAVDHLAASSQAIGQAIYGHQQQATADTSGDGQAKQADEDVVDAEIIDEDEKKKD
ncbi:Hsp70 family protein [Saccharopolyspora spinosa]|uniref:Hsp70 family protein n=1 Tax=Saccharopolyspora spinosa TaxID=60894 RepID=UPI000237A558|nr:molecular chaperone DnaK [Saccharopolyspora spinosa]